MTALPPERVTGIGGVVIKSSDPGALRAWLRRAGVAVDGRVEEMEYGRFGWAMDPEGNRFELWEPAPGL